MGPPKLRLYSLSFVQSGWTAFPVAGSTCLLFAHVFGSKALFRKFQTAAPVYRLVPERVVIWTWPLPLPSSASTGVRIRRISPTRSGLIVVVEKRPLLKRPSLTL